jgi:phosphoglycerate kinase
MTVKYLDELSLSGKRVFIRVDFNVPLDEQQHVTDDTRIREALPTIQKALELGGKVVLASHLGRPKGADKKLSLMPAAKRLSELLGRTYEVLMADDCVGEGVGKMAKDLKPGQVLMLENLRFHKQEEANDEAFARELASFADVYCNDAFGTAHRAHASTAGMAAFVKERCAGFLMRKEIEKLGKIVKSPDKPFVVILGGAKVSDKIKVIENLLPKCNAMLIGGAMAYTFLKAEGAQVGKSRVEEEKLPLAMRLLDMAKQHGVELVLPVDHIVGTSPDEKSEALDVPDRNIPADKMGLDIGSKTRALFTQHIRNAKTVLWNGPMGVFEVPKFAEGTKSVGAAMALNTQAFTVVGGGDSAAAVNDLGLGAKMTHVSTGGGASLELLEGVKLPGIAALEA